MKKLILFTILVSLLMAPIIVYAAPDVPDGVVPPGEAFEKGKNLLNAVSGFLLWASTAGAVIGIAIGVFMKFFSAGDPHKIQTGNKAIIGSIIGWGLINGATVILNTVQQYVS